MTKRIKRRVVRRKQYVPPVLPETPKVTVGPRSYGKSKSGKHIVIRFFITKTTVHARSVSNGTSVLFKRNKNWFVVDMDAGEVAEGTSLDGYPKAEAIKVARQYRDEYGAWATMPF
jgi:hypothetical protein